MKITIYTVTDCEYSKKAIAYFQEHLLPFEEKNLEIDNKLLEEMLAVGNNFAGTPVTKIVKDNNEVVVLKGFTKEEYDVALGFSPAIPSQPTANESLTPDPLPSSPPAQQVIDNSSNQGPLATDQKLDLPDINPQLTQAPQPAQEPAITSPTASAPPIPDFSIPASPVIEAQTTPVTQVEPPLQPQTPPPATSQPVPGAPTQPESIDPAAALDSILADLQKKVQTNAQTTTDNPATPPQQTAEGTQMPSSNTTASLPNSQ